MAHVRTECSLFGIGNERNALDEWEQHCKPSKYSDRRIVDDEDLRGL